MLTEEKTVDSVVEISVYECDGSPREAVVEAINVHGDGDIEMTRFSGPFSLTRAADYAKWKYGHTA